MDSVFFGIGFLLLVLDLFTKWLALGYIKEPFIILPGVFQFSLSFNPGVAFSIPIPNELMVWLTPLLMGLLGWFLSRTCNLKKIITKWAFVLIVTGSLGNFINRIITSSVIDFLDFSFWPSFNLADIYLTIGTFLIIIFYGKIKKDYASGN